MCNHNILEQTKGNFKSLRHRWEMPLVWFSGIVTFISILVGGMIFFADEKEVNKSLDFLAEPVLDVVDMLPLLFMAPIFIFLYRFYMAAKAKSNAIRVGPQQFPEIWAMYQDLAAKLEMKKLPKLYVVNGNGVVNAYALSCNTRHKYIVLHAEIALSIYKTPEVVEFVLAHEMAHHKLGHVSLWRLFLFLIPNFLVPLGKTTTRAQEYSADRLAKAVCSNDHSAMKLLAAGPWLHQNINGEAWMEQCDDEHREFYVRCANIMSDHAVMVKRYKALRDIDNEGFKTHGEMF